MKFPVAGIKRPNETKEMHTAEIALETTTALSEKGRRQMIRSMSIVFHTEEKAAFTASSVIRIEAVMQTFLIMIKQAYSHNPLTAPIAR